MNTQLLDQAKNVREGEELDTQKVDAWLKQHITQKCKLAMLNLQRIRKIREYLDRDSCHTLVLGLVMSHLDYSNSLFHGFPDHVTLRKLQVVQNMAAKLVLNWDRYTSATATGKELHWLPIKQRVQYKILTLVH